MEPIYVKEARLTNKLEIMSAVRTILNCAWLSLIDTRRDALQGFLKSVARRFGYPVDLAIVASRTVHAKNKLYLQITSNSQLIERGISTKDIAGASANDDVVYSATEAAIYHSIMLQLWNRMCLVS